MTKFARYALLSVALATAAVSAASPAAAGGRHHRHDDRAIALGIVGLATGVAVGAAIANQPRYVEPGYYDEPAYMPPPPPPAPAYYPPHRPAYVNEYPAAPVAGGIIEPWTPEWYDYCAARYRSFSPSNGTYVGYDGRSHFCIAG
jgi:U5 snRNP spliceosome subunit